MVKLKSLGELVDVDGLGKCRKLRRVCIKNCEKVKNVDDIKAVMVRWKK